MMKRVTALLLALALLFTLFGCAAETKEKDAVDEFFEQKKEDTTEFIAFDKEKEDISKDPLRILMDLEYVGREPRDASTALNEFLNTLEQSGGLTDVVIEYVPKHGADRENMLDRVRVELLTGIGAGVSMHEGLMLKETSVGGKSVWWMSPQRYEQVCEIRDRITTANFQSELDAEVYEMFVDCLMVYFNNGSDEEVKSAISEHFERMQRLVKELGLEKGEIIYDEKKTYSLSAGFCYAVSFGVRKYGRKGLRGCFGLRQHEK